MTKITSKEKLDHLVSVFGGRPRKSSLIRFGRHLAVALLIISGLAIVEKASRSTTPLPEGFGPCNTQFGLVMCEPDTAASP